MVFATNNDDAYRTALDAAGGRARGRGDRRLPGDIPAPWPIAPATPASRSGPEASSAGRTGGSRCGASRSRRSTARRSAPLECDLVAMSGGWNPAVHLSSQSGARRWVVGSARHLRARRAVSGRAFGGRRSGRVRSRRMHRRWRARRRRGRSGRGLPGGRAATAAGCRRAPGGAAAAAVVGPRRRGQGVRRLPERRDRRRSGARRARGLSSRPSMPSATPRSAWPPIRARPRNVNGLAIARRGSRRRHPRGRHHDLPAAIHAGGDRQFRRPRARQALSAHPSHCDPRLARAPRGCVR